MYEGDRSRKQTLVDFGFRLPSALDNRPLKFKEFEAAVKQTIMISATPGKYELEKAGSGVVELVIRPTGLVDPEIIIKPTEGQIQDMIEEIKKTVARKQRVLITTLTKRMSEDLTAYLKEKGFLTEYMHSEIESLKRIEIIRDLRLGKFDILVGINLLREGLDLPEVALVVILDADKEGFLRSDVTLIQTMGRAARHVEGRVIMYADSITDSMRRALDEVKRRRKYQLTMNKKFGISPRSIEKPIREKLIEMEAETEIEKVFGKKESVYMKLPHIDIDGLTPMDKKRLVKNLRKEMTLAAQDLNFELAAEIRDKIKEI
jgi:excinuclease ABC subunit B